MERLFGAFGFSVGEENVKIKKETKNLWQSSALVQQEVLTTVEFLKHLLLFTHLLHPPPSASRKQHLLIYYVYTAKSISHDSLQGTALTST